MADINDLAPLTIFRRPFIYDQKEISILQWKSAVAIYNAVLILIISMTNTPITFWAISLAEVSIFVLNLKMGGWGQENMFFWCDVYSMMMKSYNTLRLISMPLQFYFLCPLFLSDTTLDQRVLIVLVIWLLNVAEHENALSLSEEAMEECKHSGIHKVHHEAERLQNNRTIYSVTWNALGTATVLFFYTWTTLCIQTRMALVPMMYTLGILTLTIRYLIGYQTFVQHDIVLDMYQSSIKTILFVMYMFL